MGEAMLISEKLRDDIWRLFTRSINGLGAASDSWSDNYSREVRAELNQLLGAKETDFDNFG